MSKLNQVVSFPIRAIVWIYQLVISPLLPGACRYDPSCSQYMLESLKIWGPFKGTWLGLKRIGRCHPWGNHGHDPVPQKNVEEKKNEQI